MSFEKLNIVLHCMGMAFDGSTIEQGTLGGSETAAYYLAKGLRARGHKVILFTNTDSPSVDSAGVTYLPVGDVSETAPLGDDFHFYAENTPHDILIIQRIPGAFQFNFVAKQRFLWLHDIPLHQNKAELHKTLHNLDAILCVSNYHKDLITNTFEVPDKLVHVLENGVDLDLINSPEVTESANKWAQRFEDVEPKNRIIYLSRPERGLDLLLLPGGIMEQCPDKHLYFCTYNNVTEQIRPVYEALWQRAEELPNVTNLGFLTKSDLYGVMKNMGWMVYPTPGDLAPNFREVSCIAAMEAQACGLPMITTDAGALPETCDSSGTIILKSDGDRGADHIIDMVSAQLNLPDNVEFRTRLQKNQKQASKSKSWATRAHQFEQIVGRVEDSYVGITNSATMIYNRIQDSAISELIECGKPPIMGLVEKTPVGDALNAELRECYEFYSKESYAEHYKNYYEYEKQRGINYGPEDLENNSRYQTVVHHIQRLADSKSTARMTKVILDYGCAHGHYTINLAKQFPNHTFVGVDICESNIIKARKWAYQEDVGNVIFFQGELDSSGIIPGLKEFCAMKLAMPETQGFDIIIMAEVLEHVRKPIELVNNMVRNHLSDGKGSGIVITTPFGPWEAQGYLEHWPWRAHVHDFNWRYIQKVFGQHTSNFKLNCVTSGRDPKNRLMGSYVYSYNPKGLLPTGLNTNPALDASGTLQTVSLCMIIKDDWQGLARVLKSAQPVISELVIGIDKTSLPENIQNIEGMTQSFGESNRVPVTISQIESPLKSGFDAARNSVIEQANCDWILWLDSDEELSNPMGLFKYLRPNSLDAYCIKQHHFSMEPVMLPKTDYPAKLFRNTGEIQFFGRVHEHPELGLNKELGTPFIINDVAIAHYGYGTETIRRGRFKRNFPLLAKDREDYPDRLLGKFFWLRDMSQSCKYLAEQGRTHTPEFEKHFNEGLRIWEEVISSGKLRMIVEGAQFYREMIILSQRPHINFKQKFALNIWGGQMSQDVECAFLTKEDARKFQEIVFKLALETGPDTHNTGF